MPKELWVQKHVHSDRPVYFAWLDVDYLLDDRLIVIERYAHETADESDPSKGSPQGFQRGADRKKVRQIANYLLGRKDPELSCDGLMQGALVLNCTSELSYTAFAGRDHKELDGFGRLQMGGRFILTVTDGQHRLLGFRLAYQWDPERMATRRLAAIITERMTPEQIKYGFKSINGNQTKMAPAMVDQITYDLARTEAGSDLMEPWRKKAHQIAELLNGYRECVWFQKIAFADEGRGICTKTNFVNSLEPICSHSKYGNMSDEELARLLQDYWNAAEFAAPECFAHTTFKHYALQKSAGVHALHTAFPVIQEQLEPITNPLVREARLAAVVGAAIGPSADWLLGKDGAMKNSASGTLIKDLAKSVSDRLTAPGVLITVRG